MSIAVPLSPLAASTRRQVSPAMPVSVYGTLWSLKTYRLCRYLDRAGVPFCHVNVDLNPDADQHVRDHLPAGVKFPVVSIDGDWLLDPSIDEVEKLLADHGWL